MAKLYFSYAAMNAGKSTLLLQAAYNYEERGMTALLFTSSLYATNGQGEIASRIGVSAPAQVYDASTNLFSVIQRRSRRGRIDCVMVDEAQFLSSAQVWQLARVADRLDIPVMCFGLRTDFQGRLFEGSAELLAIADSLREIRTICHCGSKATMVVRRDKTGRALVSGRQVGIEKDMYVSLCRKHWMEETRRAASRTSAPPPEGSTPSKPSIASSKRARKSVGVTAGRG
ncbi:MAG: thymidine kinase [Alphaproteobacteria bacterium]|nr:thymidine kinase [Alphaproteobacteria bacterium]